VVTGEGDDEEDPMTTDWMRSCRYDVRSVSAVPEMPNVEDNLVRRIL